MVTIALQIVTSNLRPYHLLRSLTQQVQTTEVGNLGDVKVDPETFRFLEDMNAIVEECDITPGAPFLGLYNIPGVALAIQAIPPLSPWLNNKEQADFVLERMHPDEMRSAIVAFQMVGEETYPSLPQQLSGFPDTFRYCGSSIYPYRHQKIQIWQSLTQ